MWVHFTCRNRQIHINTLDSFNILAVEAGRIPQWEGVAPSILTPTYVVLSFESSSNMPFSR